MEVFKLREGEEFIELNNLLKILNWVNSGGEAKMAIKEGRVTVNGEVETRIRKKCGRVTSSNWGKGKVRLSNCTGTDEFHKPERRIWSSDCHALR